MELPPPVRLLRPSLPPMSELQIYLDRIWTDRFLTNNGPILKQFEEALCAYLGVQHVAPVANATLGLVSALRTLVPPGSEVITTPFSFVATANAIRLAGCQPVFADIDPVTLNLDPDQAEALVSPRTGAILPVHAFGRACDVSAFRSLANRSDLPLIYDAAHAFGVCHGGRSLLSYGDASVVSFHATKVFNTLEGGAVVCRDAGTWQRVEAFGNHGIDGHDHVAIEGFNSKMSELHAAVGLVQLPRLNAEIAERARVAARYRAALADVPGIAFVIPEDLEFYNHYAFPIRVAPPYPRDRDALFARLQELGIVSRRYFHPLISDLGLYRNLPSARSENLPVSREVAAQILCLPFYPDLSGADQDRVIAAIKRI